MVKPSRKLKKTLLILGVTGAVYLSFRYLLPLVIPFLFAYVFALSLRPSVLWIDKKCRFTMKGKIIKIPLAIIGGIEITFLLLIVSFLVYFAGRRLFREAQLLFVNLPNILEGIDQWLFEKCTFIEHVFKMPDGCVVDAVRDMILNGEAAIKSKAMPFLMVNSMTIVKYIVKITVLTVIVIIATILSLLELEDLKKRRDNSMFCYEYAMLGNRLATVGIAWLKTQGIIILFTMSICMVGLFLMGSPYCILLGIGIGILDALPIFGTGTVLIPWALISMFNKQWVYGFGLLIIYIICYFLREIMEAKIMGGKVGLTPLETLISMFTGLQLFGIMGFILGPIGLLLIEDIVELYDVS